MKNQSRYDPVYRKMCKEVRKRDGKCRYPGCKARRKLQVHHILPYSKYIQYRYDINNCICLCKPHHKMITGKETYYIALFREILNG